MSDNIGARPSGTGSRASHEAAKASSPSGFDPARSPHRAHDLILRIQADSEQELAWGLRSIASDLLREGLSKACCSGSPSVGWNYSYRHDPAQTHDKYFADIDEWLERQNAIAAGSGTAKTPTAAECEASQSGAEGASPNPSISSQGS